MDDAAINAFCGTGPDSSFIRSIITPVPEDYTTDLIKFIKNSGVIPEGCIKISRGSISTYDEDGRFESCGILSVAQIEFAYKSKYIEFRDKKTMASLGNLSSIKFEDNVNPVVTPPSDDSSGDEDTSGIYYKSFINKTYELKDPDDIILKCSYITIHFNHPCCEEHVTFHIKADDEMLGFTRLELLKKAMDRYHLLYYLFLNYSTEEGKICPGKSSYLFAPLISRSDYTDNGLSHLVYDKSKKYWIFSCINEH